MSHAAAPIRTILAATDFSAAAGAAMEWAAALARTHDASLELVHVLRLLGPTHDFFEANPDADQALQQVALGRLDEEAARLRALDLEVRPQLRHGLAAPAILEAAEETRPDLIVQGARGHGSLRHLLLGSTAERVVQHAPCPVLTVHASDGGHDRAVRAILVPTDFSLDAEDAAHRALALLQPHQNGARLILLHVWNLPVEYTVYGAIPTSLNYLEDVEGAAEAQLDKLAEKLRREGLAVETVTRQGHPAEAIAEEARRRAVDVVALGTHGRTGLPHLFLGSTAERVVQLAPCPVLSVRRRER
jgi:nucleotide-binding universal stress UspA family protein